MRKIKTKIEFIWNSKYFGIYVMDEIKNLLKQLNIEYDVYINKQCFSTYTIYEIINSDYLCIDYNNIKFCHDKNFQNIFLWSNDKCYSLTKKQN